METLTVEEVILLNYMLHEPEQDTVLIDDRFLSELKKMRQDGTTHLDHIAHAVDLVLLIVQWRPFPSPVLTALAAGCTTLMMNGYTFFVDRDEIESVIVMVDSGTWGRSKLIEWFERNVA